MTDSKTLDKDQITSPLNTAHNTILNNISDESARQAWLRRFWPLLLSASLSLIWILICLWWFMGSDKVISQMPVYEAGGLMAGASLPLILIWLIALVYLRTDPLRDHRMALAQGLDGLLSPLDEAQKRVNSIVTELHKEIKHVEAAGDIAATHIDNLENRFQEQITNLFEVTTSAEVKAVNIQQMLSSEREAFSRQVTEVSEHIAKLENLFKQIKLDSETIANTSREISENCAVSENKLDNISQTLSEKQAALTDTLTEFSHNTDQICDKMDRQSTVITELSQKTAEESERITTTLQEQSTNLAALAREALELTSQSGAAFQSQAKAIRQELDEASDRFKSNAAAIVQSSQSLSENLINHMNRATDDLDAKSETLEHSIAARAIMIEETLEKQADKAKKLVTSQGEEFAEKMEETVSLLESQAKRIDEAVRLTSKSLDENTVKMGDHYISFEQLSEKFHSQISQSEDQLKTHHDEFVKNLSEVAEYLDDSLQKLKNQTGSLGEHAQEIISSIVGQTEQLSGLIDDIRDRTENTIRNVQEMGDTVSHHFTATDVQAASLSENWLKTATLVENQCSDTLSRLDDLSKKLVELEKENDRAADRAEDNVASVAGQMEHASESIFLASASAIEAADETNRVIDAQAEKLHQLINALQLSNKSILIDAEAIEQKSRNKSGHHFSNLASKILEQLQSLSIDINRYFESDVPDKVWQSYVDGDKNTFVRRLKKITDKKHTATLREKIKSDSDFRKHALEYIHIFEGLMSQSMASDNHSPFSVALISSETGKVYLALAQAMNRFNT